MATINEISMTVTGNLVADPEIKNTNGRMTVARFRVAQTARIERNGRWEDGQTTFIRCVAFGQLAEHLADSGIRKGTRVVVTGRFSQRDWQTQDGQKRSSFELTCDDIGVSVLHTTVTVNRSGFAGNRQQYSAASAFPAASPAPAAPAAGQASDPWGSSFAAPASDQGSDPWDSNSDEPAF